IHSKTKGNKTMTKTNGMMLGMALALLASGAGAEATALSGETLLDTHSISAIAAAEDQAADTRTHTVDWSDARKLNTKKIVGTMLLMR
ncbi:MAG: hypothetical protein PHH65_08585, partial [Eubacteriales bacterium]|nr:hypothetical protein [Eubacteriales bacterium]